MGKEVKIKGDTVQWPNICAYCLEKASKDYEVEKTLYYGNMARTLTVQAPLCDKHYEIVTQKTQTQQMLSKIFPIISSILGVVLFLTYINIVKAEFLPKLFAGFLVGFSAFITIWLILYIIVVPLFASRETKTIKNSIRIKQFWHPNIVLYEFENLGFADRVIGLNQNNIIFK